jgi:hypothetical protein
MSLKNVFFILGKVLFPTSNYRKSLIFDLQLQTDKDHPTAKRVKPDPLDGFKSVFGFFFFLQYCDDEDAFRSNLQVDRDDAGNQNFELFVWLHVCLIEQFDRTCSRVPNPTLLFN